MKLVQLDPEEFAKRHRRAAAYRSRARRTPSPAMRDGRRLATPRRLRSPLRESAPRRAPSPPWWPSARRRGSDGIRAKAP
jgi:hypothetical protein